MPSAWLQKNRNKHGVNHILRWEIRSGSHRFLGAESCGPSKRYAESRLEKVRESLYSGTPIKPQVVVTPVKQFADEYLSNSQKTKAPATYKNFDVPAIRHFEKWYGNKPLGMIDKGVLAKWRDDLMSSGLSSNTVRMRLRALSAALGWAVEMGYLTENPFEHSHLYPKATSPARYLTEDEVGKMILALPLLQAKAFYFLLHTGLRHGELLNLDWKAIRRGKEGPWDAEISQTKTGKARMVEIVKNAQEVMGTPQESGLVFKGITRTWLGKAFRQAVIDSKVGGAVRIHDLRHTWATNFQQRTGNPFELLYRGGWSSMASAAVYQHIRKSDHPTEYQRFTHYSHTKTKKAVKVKNP